MWNWSENQIKLVFIRHGATKANKEHRYLGTTDESLSLEGVRALEKEKCAGSYPDVDYLMSSPMKRCLETAEILYPYKEPIIIPEWMEMDFGAFEGKNYLDLQDDERYQAWIDSDGMLPFPEGESRKMFIKRCEQGLYRMPFQRFCWYYIEKSYGHTSYANGFWLVTAARMTSSSMTVFFSCAPMLSASVMTLSMMRGFP